VSRTTKYRAEAIGVPAEVIVVCGLPRSGTSVLMQILAAGGIEVLVDGVRQPDEDNPRGYYELDHVKRIRQESSWLVDARGKAVKIVTPLAFDLPNTERYRMLLVERALEEVLISQEKMLARLGCPAIPRDTMKAAYTGLMTRFDGWLEKQPHIEVLRIDYRALVTNPRVQAERIHGFLGGTGNMEAMAAAIDPSLYRNRTQRSSRLS
jgi:hypothetical protein